MANEKLTASDIEHLTDASRYIAEKAVRVYQAEKWADGPCLNTMAHTVPKSAFVEELVTLINYHSQENGSDTPDFILAEYLAGCLRVWNEAIHRRETWYSRPIQAYIDALPDHMKPDKQ